MDQEKFGKLIKEISEKLLQAKEKLQDQDLERYFCKLEKTRMDMYDAVNQNNLWREFIGDEVVTEYIDDKYKVKLEVIPLIEAYAHTAISKR